MLQSNMNISHAASKSWRVFVRFKVLTGSFEISLNLIGLIDADPGRQYDTKESKKENVIFLELLLYPGERTANTSINTIASLHVLKTTVKYGFCDTHTLCSGGTDCQEISLGNYLLSFFAFGGKVWRQSGGEVSRPCESENYTASSLGSESYQTSSAAGERFFVTFPTTLAHPL